MHQIDQEVPLTADLREHILSELPCGLCVARQDEGLSVVFANSNFYRMLGYSDAEDASKDGLFGAMDCVEPNTRAQILARMAAHGEAHEETISLEARLMCKDGGRFWAIVHVSRAESGGGLWICAFTDISAQKRVEEELRVREEEYRIAVRQSDKLVLRYNIAEQTVYFPPESAELFGCKYINNLPRYLEEKRLVNPDSVDALRELNTLIVSGARPTGSAVLQLNLNCEACGYEWYRLAYSLIYQDDGTPAQAVVSLQNVSEQHAREVAYQRWEKTYEAMPQSSTAYLEFDLTQDRLDAQKGTLLHPIPPHLYGSMESVMRHYLANFVHPEDRERIRAYTAREHLLTEYFRGARMENRSFTTCGRTDGMCGCA